MQVLYINLLEINYLRKHTVVFRENRHRTSIFHCKSCAKTGIQSCAKSDSGAKFSLKITGRFSFMFQQPFRRETEIENFSNHMHTETSAKAIFGNERSWKRSCKSSWCWCTKIYLTKDQPKKQAPRYRNKKCMPSQQTIWTSVRKILLGSRNWKNSLLLIPLSWKICRTIWSRGIDDWSLFLRPLYEPVFRPFYVPADTASFTWWKK